MLIILGRMAAHGPCFWATKINIEQRKNSWPSYPLSGCFFEDAQLLPTNLLDMVDDPYLEDRQLAALKRIVDIVEGISMMAASINPFNSFKEIRLHA
jgi:hypothetical protein